MVCSGLDVPPLYFCSECAIDHQWSCDDIGTDRARLGAVGCRVCSDCDGSDHHWIESFGCAEEEPEHEAAKAGFDDWQECKHCPAWRPAEEYLRDCDLERRATLFFGGV